MAPAGSSARRDNRPPTVRLLGRADYSETWDLQRDLAVQRAQDEIGDHYLVCEHPSVYTAGKRTEPSDRPTDGSPVIDVDRGGRITWHGPGQLVVYPIVALAEPIDVVDYVRRIEQGLISMCGKLSIATERIEGRSGVWCPAKGSQPDRKIAAIGIRVQRGVTMHGLALNSCPDLNQFKNIVPCGIADAAVTSIAAETGHALDIEEAWQLLHGPLTDALDGRLVVH